MMPSTTSSESTERSDQTILSSLTALSEDASAAPPVQDPNPPKETGTSSEASADPPFFFLQDEEPAVPVGSPLLGNSAPFPSPFQPSAQMPTVEEQSVNPATGRTPPPTGQVPRRRFLPLLLVVGVVVITVIGGTLLVFAQSAPPPVPQQPTGPTAVPTQPKVASTVPPVITKTVPVPSPTPAAPPQGQPPRMPVAPVATTLRDDFHRADQAGGWGTAPGGQRWQITQAVNQQAFSIGSEVGHITATQPQAALYTALLGTSLSQPTVEVSSTFLMQSFAAPANYGVVLRYQDAQNYYKAYLSGTELIMMKNVRGKQIVLSRLRFLAQNDTSYTLRFGINQNLLMAKVWVTGKAEPGWMISGGDATFTTGQVGIRALLLPGKKVHVLAFQTTF